MVTLHDCQFRVLGDKELIVFFISIETWDQIVVYDK